MRLKVGADAGALAPASCALTWGLSHHSAARARRGRALLHRHATLGMRRRALSGHDPALCSGRGRGALGAHTLRRAHGILVRECLRKT
eukprot:scaffold9029_cov69-Phaeocystis_antarctica.AAC.4